MDKPLKSVTHGECDAIPTVTSPAAGRYYTYTKLYCLVTDAHVCEKLAQGYLKAERPRVEPSESQVQR